MQAAGKRYGLQQRGFSSDQDNPSIRGKGRTMSNGRDKGERERFVRRLKELFCSLDGGRRDPEKRGGGVPDGFGWTETEAEYQRAQAEWLRGEDRDRQG